MKRVRGVGRGLASALAVIAWLAGCSIEPQPIHLGEDECSHCRMRISDPHFAAQLLTRTGRAYKFDAIECLAAFHLGANMASGDAHSLWVRDFGEPERWIRAETATFLQSERLRSPMGLNLSAYADAGAASTRREALGGELLRFEEVLARVGEAWALSDAGAHP